MLGEYNVESEGRTKQIFGHSRAPVIFGTIQGSLRTPLDVFFFLISHFMFPLISFSSFSDHSDFQSAFPSVVPAPFPLVAEQRNFSHVAFQWSCSHLHSGERKNHWFPFFLFLFFFVFSIWKKLSKQIQCIQVQLNC
jgi:hypothetical protein